MINRESINASMLTSVAALALAAIVLLAGAWSAVSAMFINANDRQDPSDRIAQLVAEHEEEISLHQARFNGRSAFFRPPPRRDPTPPPPPPPKVEVEEEEEKEVEEEVEVEPPPPPPPPVPSEYEGPPVLYVLGDMVVFRPSSPGEPGKRIRIGQERNGIDIVSVDPPRSIRVGYQPEGYDRAEFNVPIFEWSMPGLARDQELSAGGMPGLITDDGTVDFRGHEHYERLASGIDPSQVEAPGRGSGRPQPGRSGAGRDAATPRGRTPARGRGR
jgi:hypothetical protein